MFRLTQGVIFFRVILKYVIIKTHVRQFGADNIVR